MTAPAGTLSLAKSHLRAMLAACTAFQTWTGAADAAAALERIHYEGLPAPSGEERTLDEWESLRPYAVIWMAEQGGFRRDLDSWSDTGEFNASGRLMLRFEQACPDGHNEEPSSDANLQFSNSVGQIIDGLCALVGGAGYLAFTAIGVEFGPYWPHPNDVPTRGLYQSVECFVDWRAGQ